MIMVGKEIEREKDMKLETGKLQAALREHALIAGILFSPVCVNRFARPPTFPIIAIGL